MSATHSHSNTAKSRRAIGAALGVVLVVAAAPFLRPASAAQPTVDPLANVETDPVTGPLSTANDPAIWVHPTDPSKSLILGANNTRLEVYNMAGAVTTQPGVPAPASGNANPPTGVVTGVDVRHSVTLGTELIGDVAAVVGNGVIRFYLIDPVTGELSNKTVDTAGVQPPWHSGKFDSVCMYTSPISNKTYAFVMSNNGEMQQLELISNSGKIDVQMVRGGTNTVNVWDISVSPSQPGGCVVDDDMKTLYISDKATGILKIDAEPSGLTAGTLIDHPGTDGHLLPKTQGLAVVETGEGHGYLIASSFGEATADPTDQFMVYDRATSAYVRTFKVQKGAADACEQSTGIDAAAGNLGSAFPAGVFVCRDLKNRVGAGGGGDDMNYKMVSLNLIVDMAPPTTTTTTIAPVEVTTSTTAPVQVPNTRSGYWMVGNDGKVYEFGDAKHYGNITLTAGAQAVDLEPTPSGNGYWVIDDFGHVFAKGDAGILGDVDRSLLTSIETVTSLSATKSGNGYWVFTSAGRVVPFGDAVSYGDMSKTKLNGPVLDSIPSASGNGYYMVASDGGIFSFGDAVFKGSMGGKPLNKPVQSLVPDADRVGYWLVASDGGIFAFDAEFRGSMGLIKLNKPVTGMVRYGNGYLMVAEDGGIFNFSDKQFVGSLGAKPPLRPITSVAVLDAP